ncbi:hypothetical protein HCB27_04905 [Listeria booriae]|uniref:Mga helix-turn-helix domain-containing protein n=1 Tax=Listeria booriae TaxID=1552123 RepID=A0A7X1D7U0_9LIST|nr:helix-turn-helix domain-containing protein [Listeria booriae]MBC2175943.1 hypothetical protein [Listeria booriae]
MVVSILKKTDKKLKKLLELISYLCNSKKSSIRAISLALNRSRSSIQNDIQEIKQILPSSWTLQVDAYSGVELIKPFNQTENDLIAFFVQQSLVFQLVFAPFRNQFRTIAEASDVLFVSKKALYDLVSQLNLALEAHNLTFDKKSLTILGKEEVVRNFYLCLLTYSSDADLIKQWPLAHEELLKELGIHLPAHAVRLLNICCIVATIRKDTPVGPTNLKLLPENNFEITKFLLSIQYQQQIAFHENDRAWLLSKFIQIIFQEQPEKEYDSFQLLEQQASKFESLIPAAMAKEPSFINMISHHIMSKLYFSDTSFHGWNEFTLEESKFIKSHPILFSRIISIYSQLDPPFNIISAADVDIIFQTALFIRDMLPESNKKIPTVYVSIKKGISYENHCIQLFNSQFQPWLFKPLNTKTKLHEIGEEEIIITDYPLLLEHSNNILVSPKPTELDLVLIEKFLNSYVRRKNSDFVLN